MKRLLLIIGAAIVLMMYSIVQILQNQNRIMSETTKIHVETAQTQVDASEIRKQTTVLYNIFSGFSTTTGIDFIYSE